MENEQSESHKQQVICFDCEDGGEIVAYQWNIQSLSLTEDGFATCSQPNLKCKKCGGKNVGLERLNISCGMESSNDRN